MLIVNDELRDMIAPRRSTDQPARCRAASMGMQPLREAGLKAIYNGITTIEEVVRETVLDDDDE